MGSILTSLYTGRTGLSVNGMAMAVIGDNVANVNTLGFKRARINFMDMMAAPGIGSAAIGRAGRGSNLQNIENMQDQGSFLNTSSPLDVAINGHGFFVVRGVRAGTESNFFTRVGQFGLDKDGFLINQTGLRVQGYQADSTGDLGTAVDDISFHNVSSPVRMSENIALELNLNSTETEPATAFDPNDSTRTTSPTFNLYGVGVSSRVNR